MVGREFDRQQLRALSEKLVQKANELEAANREQAELQEHLRETEREAAESLTQLGRTASDVVPELWPQLEPMHRYVLDSGEAVVNQEVEGPSSESETKSTFGSPATTRSGWARR